MLHSSVLLHTNRAGRNPATNEGSIMNTKVKSNSVVTHEVNGSVITFNVREAGTFTVNMGALHADVLARAAVHGLIQRISDKAALGFNKEANRYATAQEKFEAMKALADHYGTGSAEWSPGRAAGGVRDEGGITLRAIANVKFDGDMERARAAVQARATANGTKVAQELAVLRNAKAIAEEIARIRAEGTNGELANSALDELA